MSEEIDRAVLEEKIEARLLKAGVSVECLLVTDHVGLVLSKPSLGLTSFD
ncbi:MAG: hypothetical protein Q7T66_16975 [Herminiimonas sp.]|nr:hypothetical protein [Herminiimonas sp.]MDO9422357.1 hypothetical protein [Herminiimonas sp.]